MATDADFIPRAEDELLVWHFNYATKMVTYGTTLGYSAAEIQRIQDDQTVLATIINQAVVLRGEFDKFIKYKKAVIKGDPTDPLGTYPMVTNLTLPSATPAAGIIKRRRAEAKRTKDYPTYTEAIGADLGILTPEVVVPPDEEAKPVLKLVAVLPDSDVELSFVKGDYDGVFVEYQVDKETVWHPLGRFFKSPIMDETPPKVADQPEVRRYRARYLRGNKPIGQESDIVEATTKP